MVYIVEEVLVQLILFSHLECQEAALCGDSLVASMGVTQDDQVAPQNYIHQQQNLSWPSTFQLCGESSVKQNVSCAFSIF